MRSSDTGGSSCGGQAGPELWFVSGMKILQPGWSHHMVGGALVHDTAVVDLQIPGHSDTGSGEAGEHVLTSSDDTGLVTSALSVQDGLAGPVETVSMLGLLTVANTHMGRQAAIVGPHYVYHFIIITGYLNKLSLTSIFAHQTASSICK